MAGSAIADMSVLVRTVLFHLSSRNLILSLTDVHSRYELRSPSQEQEAMTEKTKGSHDLERGPPRVADGSDPQPRWAQRLWSFLRRQGVRSSLSQ